MMAASTQLLLKCLTIVMLPSATAFALGGGRLPQAVPSRTCAQPLMQDGPPNFGDPSDVQKQLQEQQARLAALEKRIGSQTSTNPAVDGLPKAPDVSEAVQGLGAKLGGPPPTGSPDVPTLEELKSRLAAVKAHRSGARPTPTTPPPAEDNLFKAIGNYFGSTAPNAAPRWSASDFFYYFDRFGEALDRLLKAMPKAPSTPPQQQPERPSTEPVDNPAYAAWTAAQAEMTRDNAPPAEELTRDDAPPSPSYGYNGFPAVGQPAEDRMPPMAYPGYNGFPPLGTGGDPNAPYRAPVAVGGHRSAKDIFMAGLKNLADSPGACPSPHAHAQLCPAPHPRASGTPRPCNSHATERLPLMVDLCALRWLVLWAAFAAVLERRYAATAP